MTESVDLPSFAIGSPLGLVDDVSCGRGLALISLPLPSYEHLFGGLYETSVTVMSVRNLGLLAVFGRLALLARATPDRAGLLAVTSPVLS